MGENKYLEAVELSELRRHIALDAVVGEVELGELQLDAERARVIDRAHTPCSPAARQS